LFDYVVTTRSTVAFVGKIAGVNKTIFSLVPGESNVQEGVKFKGYLKRLMAYFHLSEEEVNSILPANKQPWAYQNSPSDEYAGYEGYFKNSSEEAAFINRLVKSKL